VGRWPYPPFSPLPTAQRAVGEGGEKRFQGTKTKNQIWRKHYKGWQTRVANCARLLPPILIEGSHRTSGLPPGPIGSSRHGGFATVYKWNGWRDSLRGKRHVKSGSCLTVDPGRRPPREQKRAFSFSLRRWGGQLHTTSYQHPGGRPPNAQMKKPCLPGATVAFP